MKKQITAAQVAAKFQKFEKRLPASAPVLGFVGPANGDNVFQRYDNGLEALEAAALALHRARECFQRAPHEQDDWAMQRLRAIMVQFTELLSEKGE